MDERILNFAISHYLDTDNPVEDYKRYVEEGISPRPKKTYEHIPTAQLAGMIEELRKEISLLFHKLASPYLSQEEPPRVFPEQIKDEGGYPTEELLRWIEGYDHRETSLEEMAEILEHCWWMPDWGYRFAKPRNGRRTLELHTGGWSGNEDVIRALRGTLFWAFCFKKHHARGHYWFSVPVNKE